MTTSSSVASSLPMRRVIRTWWPLAASWLLMSLELPALSAVVARLPNAEISLAAYGGIVFPLALIIESPIIMLLAASTALSKDWASYVRLRRFMMRLSALLTGLHLLIALTPLYYVVVRGVIGAPAEIVEPARIGLIIMTPWTWSIAYRRFNQGVLIRFDYSRAVGIGTAVRLGADGLMLTIGYLIHTVPGVVVATCAVAAGVISEAAYIGLRVRPVLHGELRAAQPVDPPLTFAAFVAFYVPLVMTQLLTMLAQPIGSAAMSRMPFALESLAAWPVVSGLSFMFRSPAVAYNEVVVALLDWPGAIRTLRRFTLLLGVGITLLLLLVVTTPLAHFWLREVSALPLTLADMSRPGLWMLLPLPVLIALQSWYQGTILHSRRTRGITEAIVVFLLVSALVLGVGIVWQRAEGLYFALAAFTMATLAQTAWLWLRSRSAMRAVASRDAAEAVLPVEAAGQAVG